MNSNPLVIYHFPCQDGFTAAWILRSWHVLVHKLDFCPINHGDPLPEFQDRVVYMLDFAPDTVASFEEEAAAASAVLIIDHHATAAEKYARYAPPDPAAITPMNWHQFARQNRNDHGAPILALFDIDRSAAGMTWDFFHRRARPHWIDCVEDRDLGRTDVEQSREITAAIYAREYSFEAWSKIASTDSIELYVDGRSLAHRHDKSIADTVARTQREMTIAGYTVPVACATPELAGDVAIKVCRSVDAATYPFAAAYYDTADFRVFSLRSAHGYDVTRIAKAYGGGGHKAAAGFRVDRKHRLAQA